MRFAPPQEYRRADIGDFTPPTTDGAFSARLAAELTADDYAKATAVISVMEAFGISVAGGSFTHKLNI
jgi:hypothetical protein